MQSHVMSTPELPSYLTVKIIVGDLPTYTTLNGNTYPDDREGRFVHCEVHSDIHVQKVNRLHSCWTEGFIQARPDEWRGDIYSTVIREYGLTQDPTRYS